MSVPGPVPGPFPHPALHPDSLAIGPRGGAFHPDSPANRGEGRGREEDLPRNADLVIVGAGLAGASAAWAASRRGLSVVLLEQFAVGHDRGSSHGSARIVRRAYLDPLYVRLTGEAFELWRELEEDTGEHLLRLTGGLDHGAHRDVTGIAAALADAGVAHELLEPAQAQLRWPGMVFSGPVLHHPQAGTIDAGATVLAAVRRARERGVVVAPGTPVTGLRPLPGGGEEGVVVSTPRGDVRAGRVVVAAGAWVADLLAGWSGSAGPLALPPLEVTQQQVFHFPRRPGVPEWPVVVAKDELSTYSLPGGRDGTGADGRTGARKIAEHLADPGRGRATTASTRSGVVDPAARERIVEHVRRWYPGLEPTPFAEATCLYTTTADEDFVLDRVGPVVVCSPCSGHGAKFAPLIGEVVVDLATGAGARAGVEPRFRLGRHLQTSS